MSLVQNTTCIYRASIKKISRICFIIFVTLNKKRNILANTNKKHYFCHTIMNKAQRKQENNAIIFGLGWTTISTITTGIVQMLRLSILTRFLEKEAFGIVAILMMVLGLTQVFSDLGFSASVMSQKDLDRKSFLSLYWLQFIVFNAIMVLVALCSPLIALGYDDESFVVLIPLIMSELFFISLGKLYDTLLQKHMQFRVIAIRNIVAAFVSLFFAVGLAWAGCGVYSLVISTIIQAVIVNLWNLYAGQRQFPLALQRIDFKQANSLMKVGYYQMGTQIIDYMATKLDVFVISLYLGKEVLGVYNLTKELVLKFVTVVNAIVNKVMLPVLSSKQEDLHELKRTFRSFINKLSVINAPIVGFTVIFSMSILRIMYGDKYMDASITVKVMAVWSLFVVLGQPNSLLAIATKKTNVSFAYTIIRFIIMGTMLFSFARHTLEGAAITMLITYLVMFFVNWYMLPRKVINMGLREYVSQFFLSCNGTAVAVLVVIGFKHILPHMIPGLGYYAIEGICLVSYAVIAIGMLWALEQKTIKSLLRRQIT